MATIMQHDGEIDLDFLNPVVHSEEEPELVEQEQPQEEFGVDQAAEEVNSLTMTEQTSLTSSTKTSKSGNKKKVLSKSQLIAKIAQRTGHSTKDIKAVLEAHHAVGAVALAKVGEFKIHGLANLKTKKKEAKPERQGWNPFKQCHQTFAAKPASMQVKARPDVRVKKHLKPKEKLPTWNAKQKSQLQQRINNMVIKKSMSKAQVIDHLTHKSALPRHHVTAFFDSLGELCVRELQARGTFKVPDVANICVRQRKALPEREGTNPFTKEKMMFKARPESKVVKSTVPKALRSLAPAFIDAKSYAASSCPSKVSSQADSATVSLPSEPAFKAMESEFDNVVQ